MTSYKHDRQLIKGFTFSFRLASTNTFPSAQHTHRMQMSLLERKMRGLESWLSVLHSNAQVPFQNLNYKLRNDYQDDDHAQPASMMTQSG
jgi:hypothetical protein